jgi:DHA1 family bicyclomycin/chloramphenicol resistance-like MFS transporter
LKRDGLPRRCAPRNDGMIFAGYCFSLLFIGGLADHYGRKPVILSGLLAFLIGTLLCLWGESSLYLLSGRFLQGVGIAAPAILSFIIIADNYPLKDQRFLMSMLNGSLNTAAAIAPVIGSYITLYFHWQSNFVALFLLGMSALLMSILFIPVSQFTKQKETLSLRGFIPVLKSQPLMLLVIDIAIMCAPYWIFVGISPLLYMGGMGVSLKHFGYYQGVLALLFAFGSVIFGFMVNHFDQDFTQVNAD